MIAIILLFTSISVIILLIGFFEIRLPFIISKAKVVARFNSGYKVNYKQEKKLVKRKMLYNKAHLGFMEIENSMQ